MLDTGLVTVIDVQRESGEVAIEGIGTLDLEVPERPGLQRIDVRELNAALRSLARTPLLSAFRYQRNPAAPPASDDGRHALPGCGRACGRGRSGGRDHSGDGGRARAHRSRAARAESVAAVPQIEPPAGCLDRVARSGGGDGQAGARRRRDADSAAAPRLPAARRVRRARSSTCTPARHSPARARSR